MKTLFFASVFLKKVTSWCHRVFEKGVIIQYDMKIKIKKANFKEENLFVT